MRRRLQFGMREDPASSRRHGSRSVLQGNLSRQLGTHDPEAEAITLSAVTSKKDNAHAEGFATVGRENEPLLTVHEVAEALKVPLSWVYARTRRRGRDRLPHIKLGKYVRFDFDAVRHWLQNFSEPRDFPVTGRDDER